MESLRKRKKGTEAPRERKRKEPYFLPSQGGRGNVGGTRRSEQDDFRIKTGRAWQPGPAQRNCFSILKGEEGKLTKKFRGIGPPTQGGGQERRGRKKAARKRESLKP